MNFDWILNNSPYALGLTGIYLLSGLFIAIILVRKKKVKKSTRKKISISPENLIKNTETPVIEAKAEAPQQLDFIPTDKKLPSHTQKLTLANKSLVSYHDFHNKLKGILENKMEYYRWLMPAFVIENDKVRTILPKAKSYPELEEMYRYWQAGYRHGQLATLLIFYFAQKQRLKWQETLLKLYAYYDIDSKDRMVIGLFFSDILQVKLIWQELDIDNFKREHRQNSLVFSLEIYDENRKWSRANFKKWKNTLIFENHIFDSEPVIVKTYQDILLRKSTSNLCKSLLLKHIAILNQTWYQLFLDNCLAYGKFKKLLRLDQFHDLFVLLNNANPQAKKSFHLDKLEPFLLEQKWGKFLWYYFAFQAQIEVKETYQLELKDEDQPTEFIKYIYYLYLAKKQNWEKISKWYKLIRAKPFAFLTTFYYARALFNLNEKEKAFELIYQLWQKDRVNLTLMNEAAIYAYNIKKFVEAEEIFKEMKRLFPDHPTTLHNEAIFFEIQAQNEIEQRWHKYHQHLEKSRLTN